MFYFLFLESDEILFEIGRGNAFESKPSSECFMLKWRSSDFLEKEKISPRFLNIFPCQTSIGQAFESKRLNCGNLRKIEPSDYCASGIQGRKAGRKAIFQSLWIRNFKGIKAPKAFLF